jgi:acetyltransferase-like isoleucine patch superfamily enzyme
MKRTNYTGSLGFLLKGLLGYAAYYAIFPMWLPSWLNKLRGVRITNFRNVYIAPNVLIDSIYPQAVTIEDEVYLTRGVKIIAHFNPTNPIAEITGIESEVRPVKIGFGTFVGVNAIILPGVDIGKCSIIGAGSVVTKSGPEFSIVGGNPAKVIGDVRKLQRGEANA